MQDCVQLQTVLALFEQETTRNNGQPSCSRLKPSARRHIDQTMRTRNIRVWSEIVERRSVTRSRKGKNANVEEKVGRCYQWKAIGQGPKGDSCSFRHCIWKQMSRLRDRKDKPPLPHQMRRHRLTDRHPQKDQAAEEKALRVQAAEFRAGKVYEPVM